MGMLYWVGCHACVPVVPVMPVAQAFADLDAHKEELIPSSSDDEDDDMDAEVAPAGEDADVAPVEEAEAGAGSPQPHMRHQPQQQQQERSLTLFETARDSLDGGQSPAMGSAGSGHRQQQQLQQQEGEGEEAADGQSPDTTTRQGRRSGPLLCCLAQPSRCCFPNTCRFRLLCHQAACLSPGAGRLLRAASAGWRESTMRVRVPRLCASLPLPACGTLPLPRHTNT